MGFGDIPKKLWINFPDKETFLSAYDDLEKVLKESDGRDRVWIYLNKEHAMKDLGPSLSVNADSDFTERLKILYGSDNITLS